MTPLMLIGTVIAGLTLCSAVLVVTSKTPIYAACFLITTLLGVAAEYALLEAHTLAILQVLVYAGAIVVLLIFVLMLLGSESRDQEPVSLGSHRALMLVAQTIAMVGLAFGGIRGWLGVNTAVVLEIMVLAVVVPAMLLVPGPEKKEARRGSFGVAMGGALAIALMIFFGQAMATEGVRPAAAAAPTTYGTLAPLGELLLGPYVFAFEVISLLLMVAIVGAVALLRRRVVPSREEETES